MKTAGEVLTVSDVKRFDCTNGGAQFCDGCYTMTQDDEYGDYVLYEDYADLRARLAAAESESLKHALAVGQVCIELNEEKRARESAESRLREYEETLTGIANATPKGFDCPYQDFADEFLAWARSRARHAIRPARKEGV